MTSRAIDLTGIRHGRLLPIRRLQNGNHRDARWFCKCDCGNTTESYANGLRSGRTRSCGCLASEIHSKTAALMGSANKTHGHTPVGNHSRTYCSWTEMKRRCTKSHRENFPNYGGRGITVCDRWLTRFENFLADMGRRPEGKTLDRIDVDGNYEPDNCRWATPKQQVYNRRPMSAAS